MSDNKHYHVVGMCREHGLQDLNVIESEEEALTFMHGPAVDSLGDDGRADAPTLTNMYRTPNLVEFVATFPNGTVHYMVLFLRICNEPIMACRMIHFMDTMSKAQQIIDRGGPHAAEVQEIMNKKMGIDSPLPEPEPEPVDPSELGNILADIEKFLGNQNQEGNA
jgi:hypothetical protein